MVVLDITGMTCQHCVRAVTDALAAVPGVTRVVAVELDKGRALVEADSEPGALVAAVKAAGYDAILSAP